MQRPEMLRNARKATKSIGTYSKQASFDSFANVLYCAYDLAVWGPLIKLGPTLQLQLYGSMILLVPKYSSKFSYSFQDWGPL